jgi:VCBS repeat-containing protein
VNPSAYTALAVGTSETVTYNYDVVDGKGGSVSQTASVTINGVNDAPVAVGDTGAVSEDGTLLASGMVAANDVDIGDTHTFAIEGAGVGIYGSIVITAAATGAWEYTLNNADSAVQDLNAGDVMSDTFVFVIDDGEGGTDTGTISVDVAGADDHLVVIDFEGIGSFNGGHSSIPDIDLLTFNTQGGFRIWDTTVYDHYTGVRELAAATDGNVQGFSNQGTNGAQKLFVSSTDGSEFDFIGGLFNEMGVHPNNHYGDNGLVLTGYKDGVLTDTFRFNIDSVTEVTANMLDVDEIYVSTPSASAYFVFDDLVFG